jgi:hypothetical protein
MNGVAAPLLAKIALAGMVAIPALYATANSPVAPIGFYGDLGNIVSHRSSLLVRPTMLLLTEDGSLALVHLRWIDWGETLARASGHWSASDCTPSCATGKRTSGPARVTLYRPGPVLGHRVYRCFQVILYARPPTRTRECLRRQGSFYLYVLH